MNANWLCLCDAANISREGKLNLLGIFDFFTADALPARFSFSVAGRAALGKAGQHRILLRIMEAVGGPVAEAGGTLTVANDGAVGPVVFDFRSAEFVTPGSHVAALLLDGERVAQLPFEVRLVAAALVRPKLVLPGDGRAPLRR